jgi:hypothetical protein
MFNSLTIQFQTAPTLPAPYAHFYTFLATVQAGGLAIDLNITYPNREAIDDDELEAEGFTRNDDYQWTGKLPTNWQTAFASLLTKTDFRAVSEDELPETDDFWAITVSESSDNTQKGYPKSPDDWQYLMQELIQATYEADKRERPFELCYLDFRPSGDTELYLTASFAQRDVTAELVQNRQATRKTLQWADLQRLMSAIYAIEFDPETLFNHPPKQDGHWLNLGSEEWYDINDYPDLQALFRKLA